MSGDLVARETGSLPVVNGGGAVTLLSAIAAAASNPAADIDKMERLFAMHQEMVKREAEMAFNAAFSRAQSRMPIIAAKSRNDQTSSHYAKLAVIVEAISPIYTEEGFAVSFNNADSPTPGNIRVIATLSHPAGHSRNYQIDMPLDDVGLKGNANKTKVHATGATNAYARRYLTLMIWNLTTEDDNDAQRRPAKGAANEGAGENLTPERRTDIRSIAAKVQGWLKTGSVEDAYAEADNAGMDNDEKLYFWSLFDSKARSALKKEGERVRAKHAAAQNAPQTATGTARDEDSQPVATISQAQHKRLEARIKELGLDRSNVKAYVKEKFGKDHFPDLSDGEYNRLDAYLDNVSVFNESAPPASVPAGTPAVTQGAQGGADVVVTAEQAAELESLCEKSGTAKLKLLDRLKAGDFKNIQASDYADTLAYLRTRAEAAGGKS